ncbi:MAG: hypothetical protein GY820_10815 [Gammaproteobacteria bacterium]|nr:hypothetical protein [Gammaproteobacteria bacterium]
MRGIGLIRAYHVDAVGFWPVRGSAEGRKRGALMREGTWTICPQLAPHGVEDFLVDKKYVDQVRGISRVDFLVSVKSVNLEGIGVPDIPIPVITLASFPEVRGVLSLRNDVTAGQLSLLIPDSWEVEFSDDLLLTLPGSVFGEGAAFECYNLREIDLQ